MFNKKIKNRGATLVEYGVIAGLISVVAIGVVTELGQTSADNFANAELYMDAVNQHVELSLDAGSGASGPPDYSVTIFTHDLSGGMYGYCDAAQCSGPGSHPVDTSGGFKGISIMNGVNVTALVGPSSGIGDTYIVMDGDQRATFSGYDTVCGPGVNRPSDANLTYDAVEDETTMVYDSGTFSGASPNDQISCQMLAP